MAVCTHGCARSETAHYCIFRPGEVTTRNFGVKNSLFDPYSLYGIGNIFI